MLDKLKSLLLASGESDEPTNDDKLAKLAATALLIELSHADHQVDAAETEAILTIARENFQLQASELDDFFNQAELQKQSATSLYEFTDTINRHFNKQQKQKLICDLWRVAYADRQIDRYEEHTIRKIADLIYVSHSEFIRAKHKAAEA